ncbi:hypothetical protein [Chryseobacterium indoltheticum]|uniref:hypothetical protein n=1 Tax=Chryseobacterium indoltheticum TaxID=254 RepID=UPI00404202B9
MSLLLFSKAKEIPGVPAQKKGAFHDTESIKYFETKDMAIQAYHLIKDKFFRINSWASYCNYSFADFKLFDEKGDETFGKPQKGDYVRIKITACPDLDTPYFWVQIQNVFTDNIGDNQKICIVFAPSYAPGGDKNRIEHFYSRHSTSTFTVCRQNRKIIVAVYGRNETPNLRTNFLNKIKNIITALLSIAGMSKIQWKSFTNSLIDLHEE